MPIYVDHHARRRQVVAVASRLIATAGLDAVTIRDVADAAGCSTAIVSHYFHNKRELLFLTYQGTIDRATERSEATFAVDDLRGFLAEIMPLDEERLMEWKIWLAFWAKAAADPAIADVQRNCVLTMRGRILAVLERLERSGHLVPGLDLEHHARRLLVTITGMAIEVMFDPLDWPNERQHALIDPELNALYRASSESRPVSVAAARPSVRQGATAEG